MRESIERIAAHLHDHLEWIAVSALLAVILVAVLLNPPRYTLKTEQTIYHTGIPMVDQA